MTAMDIMCTDPAGIIHSMDMGEVDIPVYLGNGRKETNEFISKVMRTWVLTKQRRMFAR